MGSLASALVSVMAAGALLVSNPVRDAAPQHDIHGTIFLVSREFRVSKDYVPELATAKVTGQLRQMTPEAAAALERLSAACKEESGATLTAVSGYRSYSRQSVIYQRKLRNVRGDEDKANEYVAIPGASEHQMGFSMDVGQRNLTYSLSEVFANSKVGSWLKANAWRFGFIIRYPEGDEAITGYEYEPWHIRYVGEEHAAAIHELGDIPLETYLLQYRTVHLSDVLNERKQSSESE